MLPISCVVPARFASSRFPGKMLHLIQGIPLIVHTLRRAEAAEIFSEILCLTDSEKILSIVRQAGFRAELSGPADNGTDRIARNLLTVSNDLIINLQGDEPIFPLDALRTLAEALKEDPSRAHLLYHDRELTEAEIHNPNRCKVLIDSESLVVDFYRAHPHIPMLGKSLLESQPDSPFLDSTSQPELKAFSFLQLGAYAYSKNLLRLYGSAPISGLEQSESHEMLRDLKLFAIRAHPCHEISQAIDVPQDLEKIPSLTNP